MNTVEKRKIENVITKEISERISEYEQKRSDDFDELVAKYEAEPPEHAVKLSEEIAAKEQEVKELKRRLNEAGFKLDCDKQLTLKEQFHYGYGSTPSYTEYFAEELTAHSKATAVTVQKMERLARNYTLKIYGGGEEMQTLLDSFAAEVDAIMSAT